MKLKNVLCIAALSAAVALAGVPQNTAALVQAEETQIAGLDEILGQMYALYQNGDFAAMDALDTSAGDYAETVINSGSDRYVIDLDGNTKAMMYVTADGSYWWYFGQMENNLRQGQGTTVLFSSDAYEIFTGAYAADLPNGAGTYTINWNDGGSGYDISGNFQGVFLNGSYQVNTRWTAYDSAFSDSLSITYAGNHFQSINSSTWYLSDVSSYEDGSTEYCFSKQGETEDGIYFEIPSGSELFAVGLDAYDNGWYFSHSTEYLNAGLPILQGNSNVSAPAPAPAPAPSETQTPAVTVPEPEKPTPAPETAPVAAVNTYVVERGDNLSKIAAKVYGDSKYWRTIYNANSKEIKSDYIIYANQILTIPAL